MSRASLASASLVFGSPGARLAGSPSRNAPRVASRDAMEPRLRRRELSLALAAILSFTVSCTILVAQQTHAAAAAANQTQPISSQAAFLRAQRAQRQNQQRQNQPTSGAEVGAQGLATTVLVAAGAPKHASPLTEGARHPAGNVTSSVPRQADSSRPDGSHSQPATSRAARTADVFQNGDGFNIFVTNTCERELMHVNIKTSRPFYGVIHTRNQRQKSICTVEGNGDTDYNLDISHVLNPQDPSHCGVIKARKDSPEDRDLLSVVLAVRVHRNIELSDDKFFLLNCTNRCRRADCSTPSGQLNNSDRETNGRLVETEPGERESGSREALDSPDQERRGKGAQEDECTIWKFPWVITLLWCLGILLLAMIISHCIMCSSLVCRCVNTQVEETEPSVYEGATDDEDSLYNKRNHPMRIDYDNKGIYKTSNNYAPYNLEEVQAMSRQSKKHGTKTSAKC